MTAPEGRPKTIDECWWQCKCKACGMVMCAASYPPNAKPGQPPNYNGHTFLNECFIRISDEECLYDFK